MKAKKIPRSVKAYLINLALYIGIIVGSATTLIVGAFLGIGMAICILVIEALASFCFLLFLAWRYGDTLEEWGIVSKKEKKKHES